MKPDDLLDYSLGQLEGHPLAVVEAELSRDPDLLARPTACRWPSGSCSTTATRSTRRLVWRTGPSRSSPTASGRRVILDFVPKRVPFRWADIAVAAGILVAGLLTLLPAIKSGREQMNQAACSFNLSKLGTSLANYAIRHQHYPKVCGAGAGSPVGWYAKALEGESLLPDTKTLHCPCKGDCPADTCGPTRTTWTSPTTSATWTPRRARPSRSPPGSPRRSRCWPTSRRTTGRAGPRREQPQPRPPRPECPLLGPVAPLAADPRRRPARPRPVPQPDGRTAAGCDRPGRRRHPRRLPDRRHH